MLYAIIAVVVVAFIFLIVFNMRAAKRSPKPSEHPAPEKLVRSSTITEEKPPVESVHPIPSQAASISAHEEAPIASKQENSDAMSPVTMGYKRHNDDQYRQALRQFSKDEPNAEEKGSTEKGSSEKNKDQNFREALLSISKQE
ncbi:hypothetical protein [Paenibacillus sp. SI8]|uniref:hypothetical protein n=1 Tax=unclassified Paenibacillus TaxID=185978 RepID=UPI0034667CF3